jgi:hypothetical protein
MRRFNEKPHKKTLVFFHFSPPQKKLCVGENFLKKHQSELTGYWLLASNKKMPSGFWTRA